MALGPRAGVMAVSAHIELGTAEREREIAGVADLVGWLADWYGTRFPLL